MIIEYETDRDCTVVEFRARFLDVGIVGDTKTELQPALSEGGRLIVDLEGIDFMDSSGAGLLLWLRRQTQASESQLVLCGLSDQVRLVLDSLNFSRIFTIAGNRADALKGDFEGGIHEAD